MDSRIGLLECTKSRIEQFDQHAGDKHIPSLHKLLPFNIGEACLAINKNVFVDVPVTEDSSVVGSPGRLVQSHSLGPTLSPCKGLWSHDLRKLLQNPSVCFLILRVQEGEANVEHRIG